MNTKDRLIQALRQSDTSVFDSLMIIHASTPENFEVLTSYAVSIALDLMRNCNGIKTLQFQGKGMYCITYEAHSLKCFEPEFTNLDYFAS